MPRIARMGETPEGPDCWGQQTGLPRIRLQPSGRGLTRPLRPGLGRPSEAVERSRACEIRRVRLVPAVETVNGMTMSEEANALLRLAPAEKLRQIAAIYIGARAWKRAALRAQHPDWTSEQVDRRTRELFLYGTG